MVELAVEEQLQAMLAEDTATLAALQRPAELTITAARERIVTRPLKRARGDDPLGWANDPTPQCFEAELPHWVLPSIVIGTGQPDVGVADPRLARYIVVRYTLAYYAGPDVADVVLWKVRLAAVTALFGKMVVFPDGVGARLRPVGDMSSIVDIPEFPGSGKQMIERIGAYGVWRRT